MRRNWNGKLKTQMKIEEHLLAGSGVGVQLQGKIGIGSEGVSMEVWKALGDIRWGDSEPQILDDTAERSSFPIQLPDVVELIGRENNWD